MGKRERIKVVVEDKGSGGGGGKEEGKGRRCKGERE